MATLTGRHSSYYKFKTNLLDYNLAAIVDIHTLSRLVDADTLDGVPSTVAILIGVSLHFFNSGRNRCIVPAWVTGSFNTTLTEVTLFDIGEVHQYLDGILDVLLGNQSSAQR